MMKAAIVVGVFVVVILAVDFALTLMDAISGKYPANMEVKEEDPYAGKDFGETFDDLFTSIPTRDKIVWKIIELAPGPLARIIWRIWRACNRRQ